MLTPETVKNLKEKGYNIHNKRILGNPLFTSDETKNKDITQEIALIIEWLRVNHGIWITVYADTNRKFKFGIDKWNWYEPEKCERVGSIVLGETFWDTTKGLFDTPQEAYSAAIDYILNNLLK